MGKISYAGRLDPQMAAALQKQAELAPGIGEMNKLSLYPGTPILERGCP